MGRQIGSSVAFLIDIKVDRFAIWQLRRHKPDISLFEALRIH
jgi:hypothetical protein